MSSLLKKFGLGLLALGSAILSFDYFDLAEGLRERTTKKVVTNYLVNPSFAQARRKVDYELSQGLDQLDFMVWPRERDTLIQSVLSSAKSHLNSQPYSANGWYVLSQTLMLAEVPMEERFWVLEKALDANEWQLRRRYSLAMTCLSPKTLNSLIQHPKLKNACQSLISAISSGSLEFGLQKHHGLDKLQIEAIFKLFNSEAD